MAQRMIHYLFGELLSEKIEIKNKERFLLGSVLPDSYSESFERDITHFKRKTDEYVYFDFEEFRNQYNDLIKVDELYLGYYMHLVEDAFYRVFLFSGKYKHPSCPQDVAILHRDYHLLNKHILKKYKIKNILTEQQEFIKEPICKLARFSVNEFIKDMATDFSEKPIGNTYFVTEEMLNDFIETYIELLEKEMRAVIEGNKYLDVVNYMWKRNS